jgi:nitrite reductase/ring-hydroxylating ferredoxin subunit
MDHLKAALASGARICDSAALRDGGAGVRFDLDRSGFSAPAFAVRHAGNTYAYLNQCAHKFVELDWEPGQFFDADRRYLVCATHGALYEPDSGFCVAGPCRGARLIPVAVRESEDAVWLAETQVNVLK